MLSFRPRRVFLVLLSIPALFLFFLYIGSPASRLTFSDLLSASAETFTLPDEIFGLLHFVTSPEEAGRVVRTVEDPVSADWAGEGAVVPEKAVEMAWYALGSMAKSGERARGRGQGRTAGGGGWEARMRVLREEYPLVVFSKSYCPYSKRAKKLLEGYELSPPAKIIEVDLRADSSHIKTLLTRLTHRATFPNAILHGRSLGGADELMRLHEDDDRLGQLLESGGVKATWRGDVVL